MPAYLLNCPFACLPTCMLAYLLTYSLTYILDNLIYNSINYFSFNKPMIFNALYNQLQDGTLTHSSGSISINATFPIGWLSQSVLGLANCYLVRPSGSHLCTASSTDVRCTLFLHSYRVRSWCDWVVSDVSKCANFLLSSETCRTTDFVNNVRIHFNICEQASKRTPFHTFIHLSSHFIFQFLHVVLMEYA